MEGGLGGQRESQCQAPRGERLGAPDKGKGGGAAHSGAGTMGGGVGQGTQEGPGVESSWAGRSAGALAQGLPVHGDPPEAAGVGDGDGRGRPTWLARARKDDLIPKGNEWGPGKYR